MTDHITRDLQNQLAANRLLLDKTRVRIGELAKENARLRIHNERLEDENDGLRKRLGLPASAPSQHSHVHYWGRR